MIRTLRAGIPVGRAAFPADTLAQTMKGGAIAPVSGGLPCISRSSWSLPRRRPP